MLKKRFDRVSEVSVNTTLKVCDVEEPRSVPTCEEDCVEQNYDA